MIVELKSAIENAPSRTVRLRDLTRVESVKLRVERGALLFRGAPIAIGASLVVAVFALALARGAAPAGVLIAWGAAIATLSAIRAAVWLQTYFAHGAARAMTRFTTLHVVFMAINGALWGALAPLFAVHGLIDDPFLPFVIAGMSSAAIVSAGASWRAALAFIIPALAPLAVTYALFKPEAGLAFAGVVGVYAAAMTALAFGMQRMVDFSILLRTRNATLMHALAHRVEEATEEEARFRALVESSQDVTLIFSPSGQITYASPSVRKIFGQPPEAMLGATTRDVVHEDDLAQFRAVGERTLAAIGEAIAMPHVCMRAPGGDYVALGGRLTNMLYVPGVEGFAFMGGALRDEGQHPIHAVS